METPRGMQELNRTDRSDTYNDRDLLDVVLQNKEEQCRALNESAGSRLSAILPRNGNLSRPSSFVSKRSINLSQENLSHQGVGILDNDLQYKEDFSNHQILERSIYTLSLLCVSSLVLCALAIQLLLEVSSQQSRDTPSLTLITDNVTFEDVLEVATAMLTFVVVLDMSCLLVCSMQCFFVIKLVKVNLGQERALKYMKDCSSSRFIVAIGFFVSIPAFLLSVILFMVMRFKTIPAITACVILCVGILFCVLSVMQNMYHWRVEKGRATLGLPVYDQPPAKQGEKDATKELSTLV